MNQNNGRFLFSIATVIITFLFLLHYKEALTHDEEIYLDMQLLL